MTPLNTRTNRHLWAVAITLSAIGLPACGKKDVPAVASQVAAKVGSEEISVHQINYLLAHGNNPGASPQELRAMGRSALEDLINQQLAVDQAIEAKLNRSPEVVAQIEASRREVLAGAYIKQVLAGLPKPGVDELKKYYADHPQLFSERRIFNVQEIIAPLTPEVAAQLRSLAAANRPIEEAAAWLKAKDVKFSGGSVSRAAEQIPLEMLPTLHALKDGQDTVLEAGTSITLLRLVSSQSAPVNEATALPRIAQYLVNQRSNEAVAAQMKQLRANTKIAYVGEYANPEPPAQGAGRAESTPVATANGAGKSALEKGVAGLK